MICRYQSKTNLPPLLLFLRWPLILLPLIPTLAPTSSSDALLLFTSDYNYIYLSPSFFPTAVLFCSERAALYWQPSLWKKRLGWKLPPCMRCSPSKHLTQIDFILHFVSPSHTRGKKMYYLIVFFHLSNRRHCKCSRGKSKDFFPRRTLSLAGFKRTLTSHSFSKIQSWVPRIQTHSHSHTHKHSCIFTEKVLLQLYLRVHGGRVDKKSMRLSAHSSQLCYKAYICCSHIITELSEPFSGPQLPTAYEKTPIKQLSLKVGTNSVIWAPKTHWEGDHSWLTANSESGAKSIKAQIKMERACHYARLWKIAIAALKMSDSCQKRLWFSCACCGHSYPFVIHVHSSHWFIYHWSSIHFNP